MHDPVGPAAPESGDDPSAQDGQFTRVPRVGLDNVIRLLEAAQEIGSAPTIAAVAAAADQSLKSGAFRMRTAAATLFGAADPERGRFKITDRGRRLIDPVTRRAAAAEAFFEIPVFVALYQRYDGINLPPDSGIEGDLVDAKVNPRLVPTVRRIMMSTAQVGGLLDTNPKRLTRPENDVGADVRSEDRPSNRPIAVDGPSRTETVRNTVHAHVGSLVVELPPVGDDVDPRRLLRWLKTVRSSLELFYDVDLDENGAR